MKLPKRRTLRLLVQDAIDDRLGLEDPSVATETAALVASYRDLLTRLEDRSPPLSPEDRSLLLTACQHARMWREGFLDANKGTGDRATIAEARDDIRRVTRVEDALGIRRTAPAGRLVTIDELRRSDRGFRIEARREAGHEVGVVHFDGTPIGRYVEQDEGYIATRLADGAEAPFSSAFATFEWLTAA